MKNVILTLLVGCWLTTLANGEKVIKSLFCWPYQTNQCVQVGPWTCFCREHVIQTPFGTIKKHLLDSCAITTTTTTTTTTVAPNKCRSPEETGKINFMNGKETRFFKKLDGEVLPVWNVFSNSLVVQQSNGESSALIGDEEFEGVDLHGIFVNTIDDDFYGIIFSFVDAHHFYIVSWKRVDQIDGRLVQAHAGLTVQVVESEDAVKETDYLKSVLWQRKNVTGQARTLYQNMIPWMEGVEHTFFLKHRPAKGLIRFQVADSSGKEVIDTMDIWDDTYSRGRIGPYTKFQMNTLFKDFAYQCNTK